MLSYDMSARGETSLYEYLYRCIREDIVTGRIGAGERLPSKRRLAEHLGVGVVTVESAYDQLVAEGYVRPEQRRGYFVERLPGTWQPDARLTGNGTTSGEKDAGSRTRPDGAGAAGAVAADDARPAELIADLSQPGGGKSSAVGTFWVRALRSCMAHESYSELFAPQSAWGTERLRRAIAAHLRGARGMDVDPSRIFIGAGAQLLYSAIVKLLGADRTYTVENPGYLRLADIYASSGARVAFSPVDGEGMSVDGLRASGGSVAHVTPSHQFPTGTPMSVARRYELLSWAYEEPGRMIVEDDYDWEFRFSGMPIPPLAAMDADGRVLYASTFSKSLSRALRIAYLVVPSRLMGLADERLGFYANTVSVIDQVALARTLESGAYERHLSRYRKQQRDLRDQLVAALRRELGEGMRVFEADSGLHFVLEVDSDLDEGEIARRSLENGVRLAPLCAYRHTGPEAPGTAGDEGPRFVVQYSGTDPERIPDVARAVARAVRGL